VDLTTAIVTTIQALAWPAAVFGGVWLLRREIRALLERISQIKYKDLEIGIREGLARTREVLSSSSALEVPRQPLAAVEDKKDVAALMHLAHGSPRNAIIESWRLLQDLLIEVAKRKGHDSLSLPLAMPYASKTESSPPSGISSRNSLNAFFCFGT
jgi:hypothetical protein